MTIPNHSHLLRSDATEPNLTFIAVEMKEIEKWERKMARSKSKKLVEEDHEQEL